MKPIREYLQELPSPYNALALSVVDENFISYQAEVGSLANAILYMCDWGNTPQGWHFWNNVNRWCINPNNYQLPPIPVEQVAKQSADNAQCKPKYFKHKFFEFIVESTLQEGDIFEGIIVECNENSAVFKKGEERIGLNVKYFEPCDYTPAVDKQEYIVDGVDVREHNAYLKLNPIATEPPAVEVSPEVEQVEKPKYLKSTHPDEKGLIVKWLSHVSHNRFEAVVVQQGSSIYEVGLKETDWNLRYFEPCDYTPAISEAIEKANQENQSKPFCGFEFSPEVEQETVQDPKPTSKQIASFIVDLIAKTEKLEQENAQLKAPLTPTGRLHVKNLEQENTELRAEVIDWQKTNQDLLGAFDKANDTISNLSDQLAELLSNPKELVYDAEWLAGVVRKYDINYGFGGRSHTIIINEFSLSAKDSAPIIMAALAKELNPLYEVDGRKWFIATNSNRVVVYDTQYSDGGTLFTSKQSAQKAIGILTQIDPQVLKNYFA
jgi:FtsZ-binding cell division protein ZapB